MLLNLFIEIYKSGFHYRYESRKTIEAEQNNGKTKNTCNFLTLNESGKLQVQY